MHHSRLCACAWLLKVKLCELTRHACIHTTIYFIVTISYNYIAIAKHGSFIVSLLICFML